MSEDSSEQTLIKAALKWASFPHHTTHTNHQQQQELHEAVKAYKAAKKDAERQSVLDSLNPTLIMDTLNRTYEAFKRNLDKPEAIDSYKAFDAAAWNAYSLLRGPHTRRVARPSSDDDNPGQDTFAFFNVQNKLRTIFRLSYLADPDEDHRELLSAAQALYEFALPVPIVSTQITRLCLGCARPLAKIEVKHCNRCIENEILGLPSINEWKARNPG